MSAADETAVADIDREIDAAFEQGCASGLHSFSWRHAGEPCHFCGAAPKAAPQPLTIDNVLDTATVFLGVDGADGPQEVS